MGKMRLILGEQSGNQMIKWALSKAGRKVKKILKKDLPVHYRTKPSQVGSDTKSPRTGKDGVSCVIPISGTKYTVGGNHISARGGAKGWDALKYKGRGYKIRAQIVKGQTSELPKTMKRQGGNPPFRNLSASSLHGATFTRTTKRRLPIESVSALATSQMPMNKAESDVRTDIEAAIYASVEMYFNKYV